MQAGMRSIVNVATGQIGQSTVHPEQAAALSAEMRFRPIDPCHEEYLTAMGVQSSLVLPILHQGNLWGLLVAHHAQPWSAPAAAIEGIEMVVDQLAVAIAQCDLWQQAEVKAQREATINQISHHLYPVDAIDIPAALAATVTKLQGCGGRLYVNQVALAKYFQGVGSDSTEIAAGDRYEIFTYGTQPTTAVAEPIEQLQSWERHFQQPSHEPTNLARFAISDLYKVAELRNVQAAFRGTAVRGLLVIPLSYGSHVFGYLSVFRDEIETETLWAGQFDSDQRQRQPRLSFDVWKEAKQGQAHPWTDGDCLLAQSLGSEFAMSVQQHTLYQQVQDLNVNLEQQVRDRTAKLHQTLEELKATQAQLVQAEKMSSLGQLVASVAHEVNNPINFIEGNLDHAHQYFLELLELLDHYQQVVTPETELHQTLTQTVSPEIDLEFIREDFPRLFASMATGAGRIQQVVQTLLNFSRYGQSEVKAVNLHEGIESTLMLLHYRMKAHADRPGITVMKQYGDLPAVQCYVSQVNQVFMNILSNAVQAIERRWLVEPKPQPGQITVRTALVETADEQPAVEILISDDGGGMAAAVQAHVFEPFFTTKVSGKGTGLGLSISRQIVVDQHGGVLDCESTLGQGTTFRIQLPLHILLTK
jgi:signal transduction histidine kinase